MTTLPTDPPTDDDDRSHDQRAAEEVPGAPDDLDAYTEDELEAYADDEPVLGGARATYPGEDVDAADEP